MPSFGQQSKNKLVTCDEQLQDILNEAINHIDFSVIDGHRPRDRQDRYYREGTSKVRWPNSKHNKYPSKAVDIVPYPGGFNNTDSKFYELATHVLAAANDLGVRLVWGGHWKNFKDLAHFELKEDK